MTAMKMQSATTIAPDADKDPQVLQVAVAIGNENNAIQVATLGGPWSPWILGAYFATSTAAGLDILVMVEKHGKSMKNLLADKRIAFTINSGDATKDFMQGAGVAEVLDDAEAPAFVAALTAKMPWYQLYTPCAPVRIRVTEAYVTSFSRGWLPARRLVFGR